MNAITQTHLDNIRSKDRGLQNKAFSYLMEATEKPVDWAYEAWDELAAGLSDKDNHVRAIASQILANLTKSDPEKRVLKDFDALLAVTKWDSSLPTVAQNDIKKQKTVSFWKPF